MPRLVLRKLACAALLASALLHTPLRAEPPTLQDQYLQIYLLIQDADRLEGDGQKQSACQRYTEASRRLEDLKRRNPMWEEVIVNYRIRYVRQKMSALRGARDDSRSAGTGSRSIDTTTAESAPPRQPARSVTVPEYPPNPGAANTTGRTRSTAGNYDTGNDESEGLKQKIGVLQNQVEDLRGKLEVAVNSNKDLKTKLTAAMADQQELQARLDETSKQLADARASNVEGKVSDLLTENETLKKALAKAETQVRDLSKPSTKKNVAALTTQLKLVQDQLALAQKSNEDFKQTTAELKQKLEAAQNDLIAAKNAPNPSTELVQENEVMRNILTRQLQEQARRDIAKQMAGDELSRLRVQSDSLRQQIEFLGAGSLSTSELAMLRLPAAPALTPGQIASIPGARSGFSAPLTQTASATTAPANGSLEAITKALYGAVEKIGTAGSSSTPVQAATPPTAPVNPILASNQLEVTAPAPTTIPTVSSAEAFRQQQAATPTAISPVPAPSAPAPMAAYVPPAPTPAPSASAALPPASAPGIVPPAPAPTPVAIAQAPAIAPVPAPETFTPAPPPAPAPSLGAPPAASAAAVEIPIPVPAPTPTVAPVSTAMKNDPLTPAKAEKVLTPDTLPAPEAAPSAKPASAEAKNYRNKPRIPEDMKAVADSARQLFEQKKYDQAAAKYQVMIDQYPDSLYAWSNLGVVRFQQQNYPEAQRALVQAVKLAPNDAFSHSVLGIVYYQMGKYEDAVQSLTKAAALDPNDAKTQNYLGIACSQKGWQEAAEQSCRKAVELDPNYGDAHFNLAVIYATQKPPSKELARRHYKKATELGVPKDAQLEKLLQ